MNLRKVLLAIVAIVPLVAASTMAETDHGFNRMFVFGDSLSDPGNKFAITGETAHPPFIPIPDAAYGVGGHHFSNGSTWVEVLAQKMNLTKWANPAYRDPVFGNFAYAGARARDHSPTAPSFGQQVQAWIAIHGCSGAPMDDTLFVVQFGGNDLRDALEEFLGGQDPTPTVTAAINGIVTNIGILASCGAHHFLVANAPNLGAAPLVPLPFKDQVTGLALDFNDNLQAAMAFYLPPVLNIETVDFFGFVTGITMMPEAFGFTDVSTSCLTFGVVENAFCKDRDGHLFWDAVHPTKKAHAYLGELALGRLPTSN
jgi:phospholipase/lecithinase/hemolysin